MVKYLDPTNDFAFNRVFADKARLINFLNALMELPKEHQIVQIDYIPQEQMPELMHRKQGLVDLKCQDKAGNIFIVEVQNGYERHLLECMQFYAASAYTGQLERGMAYKDLYPVFVIIILGSQIISPDIPLISCHKIKEKNSGKSIFDDISYISVELEKFTKSASELESYADHWLYFLSRWDVAKDPPKTLHDPIILKAYDQIEKGRWSDAEYKAYLDAKTITERELDNLEQAYNKGWKEGIEKGWKEGIEKGEKEGIEKGRKEGIEKGRKEGIEKGEKEGVEEGEKEGIEEGWKEGLAEGAQAKNLEHARRMLEKGYSLEAIRDITGLRLEQIKTLSQS